MANPLICVFNPITSLIDEIPSSSIFAGASAAGQPVVLNAQGVIDPSLLGEGTSATAGELLVSGALVNLYNHGGALYMENAYAAAIGTSPSGQPYPVAAVGFVNANVSIDNTALVLFTGVFTYGDNHAEFSASSIGSEVYLSTITPGGITLTRPSGAGQLQQEVGVVVGFTAPNFVQVNFATQPQPAFNNFDNIITGTNVNATMTVGTGASLTFTGTGVVNANTLFGITLGGTTPTTGWVLTATSPTTADWQATTPLPQQPVTFTPIANEYLTGYTSGTGLFTAATVSTVAGITISGTPTVGWVLTATSASTADWAPAASGGTPAAPPTSVQFNNAGAFGGSAEFVWDYTNTVSAFDAALAIGNNIAGGAPFPNSRINVLDTFTTTTPSIYAGYQAEIIINGSGDFTGTDYVGYEATMATDGSANYGSIATISTSYTHESSGTIDNITGISTSVSANPGTGAANSIVGMIAGASAGASTTLVQGAAFSAEGNQGTVTTLAGVEVAVVNSAPGTVTTGYGVKVDGIFNTGTFTTYYGVFTGVHAGTAPTNYWAIYSSEGQNYFGGSVALGAELLDGSNSPGTSGYVLTSTGTATAWVPATAGAPGAPNLSIQGNDGGTFTGVPGSTIDFTNGLITLAPTGTGTALSLYSDGTTDPVQSWYVQGAANPGVVIQGYGDARGLDLFMEDNAGATVQLQPGIFKIYGEAEGYFFLIPGTGGGDQATFHSTPVTIDETSAVNPAVALTLVGDPSTSNIQNLYVNGAGTPGASFVPYGDAIGVQLNFQDAAGDTASLDAANLAFTTTSTPYPESGIMTADSLILSDNEANVFQAGYSGSTASLLLYSAGFGVGSAPILSVVGDGTNAIAKFYTVPANYATTPVITIDVAGNLDLISAGLKDHTGTLGTSGQVLSSTGTQVHWVTPTSAAGGTPTEIQYNLGGVLAGISGSSVDTSGDVTISPTADTGTPLIVLGTLAGNNYIAEFATTGSYDVVTISPPNNTPAEPAMTISGDGTNDTLDIFVNPLGPTPVFSIDDAGNVIIKSGGSGSVYSALTVTGDSVNDPIASFVANTYGGYVLIAPATDNSVYLKIYNDTNNAQVEINTFTGGATFSGVPIEVDFANGSLTGPALILHGDNAAHDIQDWYTFSGLTPAAYVDTHGTIVASSGVAFAISTQTATYAVLPTDHTINCNGTFTVTLPTTNIEVGQEYYIKNIGTGTITVFSTVNIDFASTVSLNVQGQSITVQWDGTQYWIY
jgi:hypothetical protein